MSGFAFPMAHGPPREPRSSSVRGSPFALGPQGLPLPSPRARGFFRRPTDNFLKARFFILLFENADFDSVFKSALAQMPTV